MLRTAGRLADIVGINFDLHGGVIDSSLGVNGTSEQTDEKLSWLREGAGDRYPHVEVNMRVFMTAVTDSRDEMATNLAAGFGLTPEQALATPAALVGTVDQICDNLEERRDRWDMSYITVGPEVMDEFSAVVERLQGT